MVIRDRYNQCYGEDVNAGRSREVQIQSPKIKSSEFGQIEWGVQICEKIVRRSQRSASAASTSFRTTLARY